ncbi:MAG: hypothetical protein MPJ22_00635 [Pirellulales bacterium]|nr:hypothetical protein [Alphaproteobacteria bacterium]MDA8030052.1 hypothetical protein [Alphaproteobacteria bacterium]MDA8040915.1 hypothetical protein [Pirellulales bacterium]
MNISAAAGKYCDVDIEPAPAQEAGFSTKRQINSGLPVTGHMLEAGVF